MKKHFLKFISFWIANVGVVFIFSISALHFRKLILLTMILAMTFSTLAVYMVSNLWYKKRQRDLEELQKRMVADCNDEEPRNVLVSAESPYYELIDHFNHLQSYMRHMKIDTARDVAKYRSLLASLPVGVINVNRRHIIDVFNATASELLGMAQPKVPVSENIAIKHFTLSELITQTFNMKSNQQAILNLQIGNEMKQYEVSTLYQSGNGQHAEVMIILYDLTTVLEIERMQADFLANASHELKTPLTAINGFVETLQGPAGQDAKLREQFLTIVSDEAKRLTALVNDILSLSRAQQRDDTLQKDMLVSRMVDNQWQQVIPLAREKKVTLQNKVAPDFMIHGVQKDIDTILQNLIVNAIKYNVISGNVVITAYKDHQNWQLNVKDSGIGIPKNQQTRIFERFYRGDESRQVKIASGTGLGLAIVNEIVRKHHGDAKVVSQVGVGTTISITMPL